MRLLLFIAGGAGCGKSYVTETIINFLNVHTALIAGISPVRVCAPTGTAARNINGQTIYSLLKIPVSQYLNYEPLSAFHLEKLRQKISGIHTIVLDEISMVSDRMLTIINRRLIEISQVNNIMGNFNIILVGDFFQLRPIRGTYAFKNRFIWDYFIPFYLTENLRQCNDSVFFQILNRARVGLLKSEDISTLKSKLISFDKESIQPHLHIYPLRKSVDELNRKQQQILTASDDTNSFNLNAEHYFSQNDKEPGGNVSNEFNPGDDRDAGNIPITIYLTKGTRVMLIRNIMLDTGLVNGAMGTVE